MRERSEKLLTPLDMKVLKISGYGVRRGFGTRPALIIIDAQNKFVGLDRPILESMKAYPISIGEDAHRAVENIRKLLDLARKNGLPVFYSVSGTPKSEMQFNSFAKKRKPHELVTVMPEDSEEIVSELAPKESEIVIQKRYASGFFGTPLMTYLHTLRVDTLIVTGFVTSGCVRAFVVDAASYNFNIGVVDDAVSDRFQSMHDFTLADMDIKYADVISSTEAEEYLISIPCRENKS